MKITFYGGADTVTGSNYLLEDSSVRILIDCGLYQGSNYCEKRNFDPFPYDPKSVEAVLVTHSHIDHIGRLPQLQKAGFRGKIYSTFPTKDFAEHLLIDSEHIVNKEADDRGLPHIYELQDINNTMKLWHGVNYHQKLKIKNWEIEFFDAGHILGSAFIKVTNQDGKSVVFSGDLGNVATPIVKDTESITHADYALIESTYGGRIHEDLDKRQNILEDTIEDTIKAKGVLMIPAFAMERVQALLYEINELSEQGRIPKVPIFIDSPLAIKLTDVYKKYSNDPNYFDQEAIATLRKGDAIFDFPGLKFTMTTEQSKEINNAPTPKIIIAGAGMSQGGRILHHESRYLSDPKNTILFIGYQAEDSLGRRILDGAKTVRIFGQDIPVRCRVKSIGGYSAHADQLKLLKWLWPMKDSLKEVFVVQGEKDQAKALAGKIRDELAIKAQIPSLNQQINL